MPENGTTVYLTSPHRSDGAIEIEYVFDYSHPWLKAGFLHATKEAAILHSKALVSLTARGDV